MITTIFYIILILAGQLHFEILWLFLALFFDAFLGGWIARLVKK